MNLDRKYRWYRARLKGPDFELQDYVFRGLTADERRKLGELPDTADWERYILERCVLGDRDWSRELVGTAKSVLLNIYRHSGMVEEVYSLTGEIEDNRPLLEALKWIEHDEGKMEALAVAMVPGLTVDMIRHADEYDRLRYLIIGKFVYETLYGRPAEEAFGKPKKAGQHAPGQLRVPGVGEKEILEAGGFTWDGGAVPDTGGGSDDIKI